MDPSRLPAAGGAEAFAEHGALFLARMPLAAAVLRLEDPADDDSLRLVAFNAAASAAVGFDLGSWRGRSIAEMFPGSDVLAEVARSGVAAPTREAAYADERVRDGIFVSHSVPLADRCVGIVFENVTERRIASAALRESEARCRALADAAMEAVLIHEDGRILDVSDAFVALFGWPRAEAMGMSIADLVDASSQPAVLADAERHNDERREYVGRRKDGSRFPVEGAVRSCSYQGRSVRVVVARNLTEQRRAEAAVRASEERFRVVARATNDALWELELATDEFVRGEAFAALFGYRLEDVGADEAWWHERVHPDDRDRIDAGLAAWRASSADIYADEYRFRRADGTWAEVFDRAVLMRDATGRPVRVIGAMMDITARKQMEAKLAVTDRLASLGTLAAGVAHEINNPLSYVIANVRLVEERLRAMAGGAEACDPAVREALGAAAAALDEAREGAERVHGIVADLKTFARAEEEDRRGPTDVCHVLGAALQLAEHAVRRRARLVREIEDVPPVLANEARLAQVFLTLVLNAAESIPPGAPDANAVRVIARRGEGGRVVVEFCDTGPGIAADARGRVFDPFFNVRASGERAGIGLSICHAIVTAAGGEIHVESELGRGTCFRVALPAAPEDAGRAGPAPPPKSEGRRPPPVSRAARVMVVDDEPMVGRMVARALGRVHDITSVTAARDALDRIEAGERFDVILCDLMMPAMSGMDLYDRVQELAPDQAARMVFLSGGAFTRRAREFLERHPSLDKPFDLRALEAAIQARLG